MWVSAMAMTNQELRALKSAATPGPWEISNGRVRGSLNKTVAGCGGMDIGMLDRDAALIVALVNSAEELLGKADKYDAIMDKKVAVFCHPGEGD